MEYYEIVAQFMHAGLLIVGAAAGIAWAFLLDCGL
jgi:hypothetical protein